MEREDENRGLVLLSRMGGRSSTNTSSTNSSGQLPAAGVDKRVGKEPPAEVPGLAARQPSCSTVQAGGIHTVPPQGWEFRQEKQVYK